MAPSVTVTKTFYSICPKKRWMGSSQRQSEDLVSAKNVKTSVVILVKHLRP